MMSMRKDKLLLLIHYLANTVYLAVVLTVRINWRNSVLFKTGEPRCYLMNWSSYMSALRGLGVLSYSLPGRVWLSVYCWHIELKLKPG